MRQLIVFNKRGDRAAIQTLEGLYYLETEESYIAKQLTIRPDLDGIALVIDWEEQTLTSVRFND